MVLILALANTNNYVIRCNCCSLYLVRELNMHYDIVTLLVCVHLLGAWQQQGLFSLRDEGHSGPSTGHKVLLLTTDHITPEKLSDFSHVALSSSEAELKESSQACSFTAISK